MPGKIIVTQYMSLDGVIEDPVGMEDSGLGNWIGRHSRGPAGDKFKEEELSDAQALIIGRRTYDGFAAVWPTVAGEYADRMNALPKYLASKTISQPTWTNTSNLGSDVCGAARDLKNRMNGNILIFGSASICHQLMTEGLVDEISLFVYPVTLGRGIKLFPDNSTSSLELLENTPLGDGIMLLRYRFT